MPNTKCLRLLVKSVQTAHKKYNRPTGHKSEVYIYICNHMPNIKCVGVLVKAVQIDCEKLKPNHSCMTEGSRQTIRSGIDIYATRFQIEKVSSTTTCS